MRPDGRRGPLSPNGAAYNQACAILSSCPPPYSHPVHPTPKTSPKLSPARP